MSGMGGTSGGRAGSGTGGAMGGAGSGTVAGNAGRDVGGAAGGGNAGAAGFFIAGAAGRIQGGAGQGGSGGSDGSDCDTGCLVDKAELCDDSDVTWACEGNHDQDLFREECEEQNSSGRLRYCCPKSFLVECQ
jgi:hypothetical protein